MVVCDGVTGVGLGLRQPHTQHILQKLPEVAWFEILFDNFRPYTKRNENILQNLFASYPLTLHCVGMNLGSPDPLDFSYLKEVRTLKNECKAKWISDHLCWSAVDGIYHHDLLPLAYTREVVQYLSERIDAVQNFLGEQILVENISSYIEFKYSELEEVDFLNLLCEKANCRLLLDINNIYVNAFNFRRDAFDFFGKLSKEYVAQYHLAGYDAFDDYLLDSHGQAISEAVWELFFYALKHVGPLPTSIERDGNIPSFGELYKEKQRAESYYSLL